MRQNNRSDKTRHGHGTYLDSGEGQGSERMLICQLS